MARKRAIDKVRNALPETPRKRAKVLEKVCSRPRTRKELVRRGLVTTPEEQKETASLRALAGDISHGLEQVKQSRSNEKRAVLQSFKSLAFGENVKKKSAHKSYLSKLVSLHRRSISQGIK